ALPSVRCFPGRSVVAALEVRQSSMFSQLRGLLEVTRLVRTAEDVPDLLESVARTGATSLGFRTVVVNLYRPEWDDFVVSTVFGSDAARETLLGRTRTQAAWEPLLDLRFLRRGAYLVPAGHYDWSNDQGASYTPNLPVSGDPGAWHPDD